MKHTGWIGWTLIAIMLVLAGCPNAGVRHKQATSSQETAQEQPVIEAKPGGAVRLPLEINSDDPKLMALDFSDHRLFALARAIETPLVRALPDGQLASGLAASWEMTDAGQTWRFKLQTAAGHESEPSYLGELLIAAWRGVLVGDETPLREQLSGLVLGAADVAQGRAVELAGLSIEQDVLIVKLTRPHVVFPAWASQPGLGVIERDGDRVGGFGTFTLASRADDALKLLPNPASLCGTPLLDELVFICEPRREDQVELFKAGKLDAANLSWRQAGSLEFDDQLRRYAIPHETASMVLGVFNHNNYPWQDEQFFKKDGLRGVLNFGRNLEDVAMMQNGQFTPWPHFLPHVFDNYTEPALISSPLYALSESSDKVKEGLYASDHEQGGKLPQGMHTVFLDYEHLDRIAEDLISFWRDAAVRTDSYPVDDAHMHDIIRAGGPGGHDIILQRTYPAYPDPDAQVYTMLHGELFGLGGNWSLLNEQEINQLIETTQAVPNELERRKQFQNLTGIIEARSLFAFAGYSSPTLLVSPRLAGYVLGPFDFDASLPAQDFSKVGLAAE